jgi:hypothetical protein
MLPKRGYIFTWHWFYTPGCCQLAAETFLHPIHFHTSSGAMLCLPLASLSYYKINPIALQLWQADLFKFFVAFMNPFDNQMHVSWYHVIDTKHVHILVKFERRLFFSVLRIESFFKKREGWAISLEKIFVSLFSPELNGQPAFKFNKNMDVPRIYCMIPRTTGFLG